MPDAVWDNENTGRPSSDFYENGKNRERIVKILKDMRDQK